MLLQACSSHVGVVQPAELDSLLDGTILFGEPVSAAPMSDADIVALDDDMRAFVRRHVRDARSPQIRLRRLLGGMIDEGYLDLVYEHDLTHTARQTFHSKKGNCLSFTNLFVALAREANLQVAYQLVDIPPVWNLKGDFVLLDKHINVVVDRIRVDANFTREYVVDFNIADFQGNYDRYRVSDAEAFALYYSNRGVEALHGNDDRSAFAFFRRAIDASPRIPALWVNLGALYARGGKVDAADKAYRKALSLDGGNRSALANLARLHEVHGNAELAKSYRKRIDYYRDRNPYFHFQQSLASYENEDWDQALHSLQRALRLKRTEHQFHYLRALLAAKRGESRSVMVKHLDQALSHAEQDRVRQRYMNKLTELES